MHRRTQKLDARLDSSPSPSPAVTSSRSPFWPDGRIGPVIDPASDRRWAMATLAMLGVVVLTLGTLVVG